MSQLRKFHVRYKLKGKPAVHTLEVLADRKVNKKMATGLISRSQNVREAVVEIRKIEEKNHS